MNLYEAKRILRKNGYLLKEHSSTTELVYRDDDLELKVGDKYYRVDVEATADYWSTAGDRWEPADDSFDINEIDAEWYELSGDNYENETKVEETKEMYDALYKYLMKNQDQFGYEGPTEEDRAEYEYERMRDGY